MMQLILEKRGDLCEIKDGSMDEISKHIKSMAYLLRFVRVVEEIAFVLKNVKRHQEDESLAKEFQFISNN